MSIPPRLLATASGGEFLKPTHYTCPKSLSFSKRFPDEILLESIQKEERSLRTREKTIR